MRHVVLPLQIKTNALEETVQLAGDFAASLEPHAIVLLDGPMGAGKTAFVRGICAGLGMERLYEVDSPTYTILNHYEVGGKSVDHLDLFRLSGAEDLEQLDFPGLLSAPTLLLIEWPDRLRELPEGRPIYLVRLGTGNESERYISIQALSAESRT